MFRAMRIKYWPYSKHCKMRILLFSILLSISFSGLTQGKGFFKESKLNGSLETNNQYYLDNKRGNILAPEKRFASNTYLTATINTKDLEPEYNLKDITQPYKDFQPGMRETN